MEPRLHILGAGTMGAGLAHCAAIAGMDSVLVDMAEPALERALKNIARDNRLLRLTGRKATPGDIPPHDRIKTTVDIAHLKEAQFVFECLPEKISVKEPLYARMDALCPAETIVASVTSAIPIARIGGWTGRPDRIVGAHFMNPPQWKDTAEVVRSRETSDETWDAMMGVLKCLGKRAIPVPDGPGFIINRLLMPAINDAAQLMETQKCGAATVDRLFRDCLGHRSGPLETADLIGLDTVVDTLEVLRSCLGDQRFTPSPVLLEMVASGKLGKKSGRGFYDHEEC